MLVPIAQTLPGPPRLLGPLGRTPHPIRRHRMGSAPRGCSLLFATSLNPGLEIAPCAERIENSGRAGRVVARTCHVANAKIVGLELLTA